MKKLVFVVVLVFAATLPAVVGQRLSAEAMAVVVGVVCGVVAGIPASILLMLIMNRRDQRVEPSHAGAMVAERYGNYPPVVVIQGGSPTAGMQPSGYYPSYSAQDCREFHLVGVDRE